MGPWGRRGCSKEQYLWVGKGFSPRKVVASIAARVHRGPWRMKTYTVPLRLRISLEILVREGGIMRKICSKHLLFSEESHEAAYNTELLVVTGQRTGMS